MSHIQGTAKIISVTNAPDKGERKMDNDLEYCVLEWGVNPQSNRSQ